MPLIGGDIYGGDLRVEHAVRCQTDSEKQNSCLLSLCQTSCCRTFQIYKAGWQLTPLTALLSPGFDTPTSFLAEWLRFPL